MNFSCDPYHASSQFHCASAALVASVTEGGFPVYLGRAATIVLDRSAPLVLHTAARLFSEDVGRLTGVACPVVHDRGTNEGATILLGLSDAPGVLAPYVAREDLDFDALQGPWEAAHIIHLEDVDSPTLAVVGSDARGAAYALMELSRQMGVSPWHWWADVPPTRQESLFVRAGSHRLSSPRVRYRGLFINDEIWSLQAWARETYEPEKEPVGPHVYRRIFELLLRLKANLCWPAMHYGTAPFYAHPENPRVAEEFGIIIGTSHLEMLHRNTMIEWDQWQPPDGGSRGAWNFFTNASQMQTFWAQRLAEAAPFENIYTLGLRGVGDGAMQGPEDARTRVEALENVMAVQRDLLRRQLGGRYASTPQVIAIYKEVLDLYRQGMQVPEDMTILWPDDNHGYLRQLPNAEEQQRPGGHGLYQHLSYWGTPEDYLWLSSTSPHALALELRKALAHGVDRLWVVNGRGIKPLEKELDFFFRMAWDPAAGDAQQADHFIEYFMSEHFGDKLAVRIADLYARYYQLASTGRPEHIDRLTHAAHRANEYIQQGPNEHTSAIAERTFSVPEMEERIAECQHILDLLLELEALVPAPLRDAFFQLVSYPLQAAARMNQMHLTYWKTQGSDNESPSPDSLNSAAAHEAIQCLARHYHEATANGKWKEMANPRPRNRPVFDRPSPHPDAYPISLPQPAPLARIAAADFTRSFNLPSRWVVLLPWPGGKIVATEPIKGLSLEAIEQAPWVEYELSLSPEAAWVEIRALPTHPATSQHRLRIGLAIGDQPVHTMNFEHDPRSPEWMANVLSGYSRVLLPLSVPLQGNDPVRLRIYLPDPGVVLREISIQANPPRTKVWGSTHAAIATSVT